MEKKFPIGDVFFRKKQRESGQQVNSLVKGDKLMKTSIGDLKSKDTKISNYERLKEKSRSKIKVDKGKRPGLSQSLKQAWDDLELGANHGGGGVSSRAKSK